MRAYVANGISRADPLSVFQYNTQHPKPTTLPSATTILVRIAYAGVNPADIQYVNGQYEHAPAHPMPRFPAPMGVEGAGVVVAVGSKATKFRLGDHVLGLHKRMDEGTFAEFATFEEAELALKPVGLCWQLAAAMPVAGVTALSALTQHRALKTIYDGRCKSVTRGTSSSAQGVQGTIYQPAVLDASAASDSTAVAQSPSAASSAEALAAETSQQDVAPLQSILILGASGGVGSFTVLLAKHVFEIPLVIATCSASNAQYVQQLGADVVIDYRSKDVEQTVLQELQQRQHLACTTAVVAAATPASGNDTATREALPSVDAVGMFGARNKAKLDLVIDNVGGSQHLAMAPRVLKPTGTYVTSVPLADPSNPSFFSVIAFFTRLAALRLVRFLAFKQVPAVVFNTATPDGDMVQHLADWLAASDAVVHGSSMDMCLLRMTVFDLEDAGSALLTMSRRHAVGKLVLRVAGDDL